MVTIRKEWVTETIGLVLWFGVRDQEDFSRNSTHGKEKLLVKDVYAYFKVMI